MKKSWWKVPLYCMVASWICFQLEIRFLGRWAIVTLPDGSISSDNTRWMLMSAGLFLAVVCIGGFFLFRKMTRKEIFFSSSALVALNIVLGIFTYLTQRIFTSFAMLWSELSEWASVFSQIAFQFGLNEWLSAAIVWILPPYIFLLFGKKEVHTDWWRAGVSKLMLPPLLCLVLLFSLLPCFPPDVFPLPSPFTGDGGFF